MGNYCSEAVPGLGGSCAAQAQPKGGRALVAASRKTALGLESCGDGELLWGWRTAVGLENCCGFVQSTQHPQKSVCEAQSFVKPLGAWSQGAALASCWGSQVLGWSLVF